MRKRLPSVFGIFRCYSRSIVPALCPALNLWIAGEAVSFCSHAGPPDRPDASKRPRVQEPGALPRRAVDQLSLPACVRVVHTKTIPATMITVPVTMLSTTLRLMAQTRAIMPIVSSVMIAY